LAAAKTTYLLLNIPAGRLVDPKQMIFRSVFGGFSLRTPILARQSFLDDFGSLRTRLTEIATAADVRVIDPLDSLCPEAVCPSTTEDGRPIYKDEAHLRPFYIREHASFIDEPLQIR
jgi:hypothetical protein